MIRATLTTGIAVLALTAGCTPKAPDAAKTTPPATTASAGTVVGSNGQPTPPPWVGHNPPPGSAVPAGGPKIPGQ